MNELEKAWLAGFFDGDGCVIIDKLTRDTTMINPLHRFRVSIGQKDRKILDYIQKLLGHSYVGLNGSSWQIQPSASNACKLLKQLLPYLKVKKLEAQVAIQFQENKKDFRGGPGGSRTIPPEELAWREMHHQLLKYIRQKKKEGYYYAQKNKK